MPHRHLRHLRRRPHVIIVAVLLVIGSGCAGAVMKTADLLDREAASSAAASVDQGQAAHSP